MRILILVCIIHLFALKEAIAQRADSVQIKQKTDTGAVNQPAIPGLQSPDQENKSEFTPENTDEIQVAEVPPVLRKTLTSDEYRGWEKGRIYRNRSTQEYKVEIQQDPYVKTFFFDKNGERILE